jgi:thiamine pyrophosphate-dependent acetolactate synthase large subunit-like protein
MRVRAGRAGVFLAGQNGPGATNLVTGLAQAQRRLFAGDRDRRFAFDRARAYRDAFQEVDQQALFSPVTKKTWTVAAGSGGSRKWSREAYRTATAPRRGPVVLNIARDMLAETAFRRAIRSARSTAVEAARVKAPVELVEREAARLLAGAQRPLILAGGGREERSARRGDAAAGRVDCARRSRCRRATATRCRARIRCTPARSARAATSSRPRSHARRTSSSRLARGSGFNTTFYTYDHLNPSARIIQVEIEPTAIGRFFPVELGILGDAGIVAAALAGELRQHAAAAGAQAWSNRFRQQRSALLEERDRVPAAERIQPGHLFRALRAVAPRDSMYTMDAGTLCLQATDQLNYAQPPALFTPLDFGLVGFSYACGLGVKVAAPDRTVISLMGDGGFGMTTSEIGTAVASGINTVCIVMNNGCWGAEKAYQRDFFGGRYLGADVPNPPYDRLAELWGAAGFRVEQAAQLESTLAAAIAAGRPAIVDVMVDPDALYSFRRDSFAHRAAK